MDAPYVALILKCGSNYHFPIDLAPIGIPFDAKSFGKREIKSDSG